MGNGELVEIDLDAIMGIPRYIQLSIPLINFLRNRGIIYIRDAIADWVPKGVCTQWKGEKTIGLFGDLAVEWEIDIHSLQTTSICCTKVDDQLTWNGPMVKG